MAQGEAVRARTASNSAYRGVVPRFAKAVLQAGARSAESPGGEQNARPDQPRPSRPQAVKPVQRRGRDSTKPKVTITVP